MSFNLVRTVNSNLIDIRPNYKHIADEFCKYYYTVYDTNFPALSQLYYFDSQFTYQEQEFNGFNIWINGLVNSGVHKFTHHSLNITAQPLSPSDLIITILGTLSVNDSIYQNKFIEILILRRDENNTIHICSTIFRLVE